jgi:YggT family protein
MNFFFLATLIRVVAEVFIWVVIASALLSYFLAPYHPVRQVLDRIVDPFLNPIRRILPKAGMIDFSPIVLIIAVELISRLLASLILSLG